MPLRSALFLRIWQAFKVQGIDIPSPQREIRVTSDQPPGQAVP